MIENCPLQITSYIAKYGCIESWKIYLKRAQFMQIENYVGDYLVGVFLYKNIFTSRLDKDECLSNCKSSNEELCNYCLAVLTAWPFLHQLCSQFSNF